MINIFIEKSNIIHKNFYTYENAVYINNKTKIKITCPIHGEFLQILSNHLSGSGCLKCSLENKKRTINKFIEDSNKIHNYKYTYENAIYINNYTKIEITCSIHGIFLQKPNDHLSGHGCGKCKCENLRKIKKSNTDDFIIKANKIHNNKYSYDLVKYIDVGTKIKIICPIHGEFIQTPSDHLSGYGCKKCRSDKMSDDFRLPLSEYINKCNIVHDNKYDYSLVLYKNQQEKVKIICPKHGIFSQKAYSHLLGHGCSKCSKISTKPEAEIYDNISKLNMGVIKNDRNMIKPYEIDIYISDLNIGVEYCGIYWHSNKFCDDMYHYDKMRLCNKNNIHLITIFEDEWLNNKTAVINFILSQINVTNTFNVNFELNDISVSDYNNFISNYSIQNSLKYINFMGLYCNGELISVTNYEIHESILYINNLSVKYRNLLDIIINLFNNRFHIKSINVELDHRYFNSTNMYIESGFNMVKSYYTIKYSIKNGKRFKFNNSKYHIFDCGYGIYVKNL